MLQVSVLWVAGLGAGQDGQRLSFQGFSDLQGMAHCGTVRTSSAISLVVRASSSQAKGSW